MIELILVNKHSSCFIDEAGGMRTMGSWFKPHIFTSDNIRKSIGEDWEVVSLEEFISLRFIVSCMEM